MLAMISLYVGLLLLATPQQTEQAKTLYQAGNHAYQVGKYAVAIEAFEAARALSDRPMILFSLAQSHRLRYFQENELVDLEAAVKAYREYVATWPEGPRRVHAVQHLSTLMPYLERLRIDQAPGEIKRRAVARLIVTSGVEGAVAQVGEGEAQPVPATFEVKPGPHTVRVSAPLHLEATQETVALVGVAVGVALHPTPAPAQLKLRTAAGTRVMVDNITRGRAPLLEPLSLTPGHHELILRATGRAPQVHHLDLHAGGALTLEAELEPTTQRSVAWILMSAAAAFAIGAGVTGALSLNAQEEAEALEAQLGAGLTGVEFDEHADLRADRDLYARGTLALGLTASSALVMGILLYLFDDPSLPRRELESVKQTAQTL